LGWGRVCINQHPILSHPTDKNKKKDKKKPTKINKKKKTKKKKRETN